MILSSFRSMYTLLTLQKEKKKILIKNDILLNNVKITQTRLVLC